MHNHIHTHTHRDEVITRILHIKLFSKYTNWHTISPGLILSTASHCVGDIGKALGNEKKKRGVDSKTGSSTRVGVAYSVQEEESGEVRCVEGVEEVDKLGAVDGVGVCEPTAREDAELEELGDSSVLQHL